MPARGDNLHLVLISRTAAPFPIQRMCGLGHVLQVSAEQLAFSPEETRSLAGVVLEDEAEELTRRSRTSPRAGRSPYGWR